LVWRGDRARHLVFFFCLHKRPVDRGTEACDAKLLLEALVRRAAVDYAYPQTAGIRAPQDFDREGWCAAIGYRAGP